MFASERFEVVSLQIFRKAFSLSDYFEIYLMILLLFYQQKQPPEVLCKKVALKNLAIFTGKHLCWNLFLTRFQVFRLRARNFIKMNLQNCYFSVNIEKISTRRNICEWILLHQSELFMFHYCNVLWFPILKDIAFVT